MVAFTGHKYLLGPPGTGGLYISPTMEIDPVWVGGTGIQSELDEMPAIRPIRFEAGTPNDPAFAGLAEAISWGQRNALDATALLTRIQQIRDELTAIGANVIAVDPPYTLVISFTLNNWETEDAGEILHKSFEIVCRTGLHCAPRIHACIGTLPSGTVRLSLSRFTTHQEIEYCLQAISRMVHDAV